MPLMDPKGQITSLQFIDADCTKRFLKGGKKQGSFFETTGKGDAIYLVEGYATGATVHLASGGTVIVACDAGNLLPVSKVIRDPVTPIKWANRAAQRAPLPLIL